MEIPRPRLFAAARSPVPSAPDWLKSPRGPGSGKNGDKEALRATSALVFAIPNELGPTTRIPCERAVATTSRCSSWPSGPVSANPEDTTTTARTPRVAASLTTSMTAGAGTAIIAKSIEPSISSSDFTVGIPATTGACGWTMCNAPLNPAEARLRKRRLPAEVRLRDAPMTATEAGLRTARTDRASARCSRASSTCFERSVGSISKRTATTPSSNSRETS